MTTTVNSIVYATGDSSCAALMNAGAAAATKLNVVACSKEIVGVGDTVLAMYGTTKTVMLYIVGAQSSPAPASLVPSASQPLFQSAATSYTSGFVASAVAGSAGTGGTVSGTVTLAPSLPDASVIEAQGFMFAATLVALAVIFGLKRVYRLFVPESAGHE